MTLSCSGFVCESFLTLEEVSVYETFWKKRSKPCLCDTTAGCTRSVKIKNTFFSIKQQPRSKISLQLLGY